MGNCMKSLELCSETFTFTSKVDNALIFARKWSPSDKTKIKSLIHLTHGICEHSGRYERFGKFLASHGCVVYALDLRGHGLTAGLEKLGQGDIDTWDKMTADIKQLADIAKDEYPDLPLYAFGHSMGSGLIQSHIQNHGEILSGAILCGTFGYFPGKSEDEVKILLEQLYSLAKGPDAYKPCEFMGEILASFNGPFIFNKEVITGCEWQTQDDNEIQEFLNDPLCGQPFSNVMTYSIVNGLYGLWNKLSESQIPKDLPILIICGKDDPVGEKTNSVQQLITRYMSYGINSLSYVFYPGQRHEILNEPCKDQVHLDIERWLNRILSSSEIIENKLFVLQVEPPSIYSLNLKTGLTEKILDIDSGVPDGIQVLKNNRTIYWTNMGILSGSGEVSNLADGSINSCSFKGKNYIKHIGNGTIVTPKQLQSDPKGGYLYWCDREGMAIYRSSLTGDELKVLYRSGQWPTDASDETKHCVGIALDLENKYLYWTQKGSPDGGQGRIFRMGLEIPDGQSATNRNDLELLLDELPEPIDLEIDEQNMQIYWTDRGLDKEGGNSLNRADITPSGLKNHQIIARGLKEGIGLALDKIKRKAYVSDLSGTVRVVSMDGGEFEIVHSFSGPITGISFQR